MFIYKQTSRFTVDFSVNSLCMSYNQFFVKNISLKVSILYAKERTNGTTRLAHALT